MNSVVKLYNYDFRAVRTYLFAVIFIAGNLVLPRLFHAFPLGGPTFLPIYFFTLIAAYKYGIRVGLLTAILSPLLNNLLFGMPVVAMLPIILTKSTLLAISASVVARRSQKVSLLNLLLVVLAYQLVGTAIEWAMVGSFYAAIQDIRLGFPGMILQIVGGYALLKAIAKL